MATFYSIHQYDQESRTVSDLINNCNLYTTFEKAAQALDVFIRQHIEVYNVNKSPSEDEEVFTKPTFTMRDNELYCHYYESYLNHLFVIYKRVVVE